MAVRIHPTAMVDPEAELGAGVRVGPHVVVEGDVVVGDDCELMTGAVICRGTRLGAGNVLHPFAVLGGLPQDTRFDPETRTYLRVGSGNVFREHVTLSRATVPDGATIVGDGCYFMTQSHVGHDSIVGDRVILTNNAAVAGHVEVGDGAVLSAGTMIHQYCWLGELAMLRGTVAVSQHVPPFVMVMANNYVAGLNVVGMRRAEGIGREDVRQIKEAYRLLYRSSLSAEQALEEMDRHVDWGPPAGRFREFVRRVLRAKPPYDRGLVTDRHRRRAGQWDL